MPVGSVLELYTSVLAWNLYGALWAMLVSTGVVLIPFIVAVIDVLLDARESPYEISSDGLMSVLETKIYVMLIILFFAAQPMIYVHLSKTSYSSYRCGVSPAGVVKKVAGITFYGDSNTTLDKSTGAFAVMLDGKTPQAPLWWYLVTKLNQALTQAAKQELPCQTDLRAMASGLAELDIADKNLKDELRDFYSMCWQPAVNQFGRERLPDSELPSIYKEGAVYNDIAWPGSEFLLNRPGYYDTLRTSKELSPENFPYKSSRDSVKMPEPPAGVEMGGYPTCYEWWLGYGPDDSVINEERGLRTRLLSDLKANDATDDCAECTGSWWKVWSEDKFTSDKNRDDALLKSALFNARSSIELNLGNGASNVDGSISGNLTDAVMTGITVIGATFASVPDTIETESYRKIGPAIQAVTLLVFIVLLPMLMVIGLFNLGSLLSLSILQFSIVFWGFLFALAAWLDNFLMDGLLSFGDDGEIYSQSGSLIGYLLPNNLHSPDMMTISWVVRMCYYLLPLLFTVFLGAIGHSAGRSVSGAMNSFGMGAANKWSRGVPKVR